MILHIYEHCPYCIKARMIFGLKDVPVTLNYIANDDVETPTRMIGQKMVPILELGEGNYMPESMDIVHYVDKAYSDGPILTGEQRREVADWLAFSRRYTSPLAMPRWVRSDFGEFETQGARDYFQQKKEQGIGGFDQLMKESAAYIEQANRHLKELEPLIQSAEAVNGELSEDDIHLFPTLRSLSIVKGLIYPPKVDAYRKAMAVRSNVPLHDDIAI